MKFKEKIILLYATIGKMYQEQFGFKFRETTFAKLVNYLHTPKDPSSLAVTRILFGLMMLFDIPDERGGAIMNETWGEPKICHFPLFSCVQGISMPFMALVYALLWIGALGIMLGYKYHITAPLFTICYWYLFIIEKSYWNNHSYLFGLVSFLLACTQANCFWSLDAYLEPSKFSKTVPYWNYFILKFQFFILYFMAGVKKGTAEWLTGYSVPKLSSHWVFTPFTLFLTVEQTDYFIVHWFIFLFDLTVAFWMMWSRSRHIAMIFCALFHLMNIRLFTIGMFPWVCLATMPLFYPFHWPKLLYNSVTFYFKSLKQNICQFIRNFATKRELIIENSDTDDNDDEVFDKKEKNMTKSVCGAINDECITRKNSEFKKEHINTSIMSETKDTDEGIKCREKVITILIIIYVIIQSFLPFSHFITKGYNNWTNGLYGYSWDMMVHTWDVQSIVVKVVDNENNNQLYIDPDVFTPNDRWFKHGDMVHQYAICLKNKLINEPQQKHDAILSKNISIFVDVWCSMNGRFVQRMFDSRIDLLQATWNPFQEISFLMPLLDEASAWRSILDDIRRNVHSWNQFSDVIFFADFPGYTMEKYIPPELSNVTLTILKGQVVFEPEVTKHKNGQSYKLDTGGCHVKVNSGMFHRVLNIGKESAFYMYTFYNTTESNIAKETIKEPKPKLPIIEELGRRFRNMIIFANATINGIYQSVFRLRMFLV